jgi:cyanophycin synthetase
MAVLNADDPYVARMAAECRGAIVLFSMETEKGSPGFDRVDGHTGRGGAAFVIRKTPEGDQIVLRHGPRVMPLLYTHLIPATFGGRARMNVANALAAAAAAWANGAHIHDIRQGLRTFTTSFFQAPGRLNLVEVGGIRVVIDYCHNVDGMRNLADFTRRMMSADGNGTAASARHGRAIGVIGMPGDRRDEDMRDYGRLAAGAFDELIVREDRNLRGRKPGETAEHVAEGARAEKIGGGGRPMKVDKILDELTAVRTALRRANSGDLLVMCVDDAVGVYKETMEIAGKPGGTTAFADPGELEAPEG